MTFDDEIGEEKKDRLKDLEIHQAYLKSAEAKTVDQFGDSMSHIRKDLGAEIFDAKCKVVEEQGA